MAANSNVFKFDRFMDRVTLDVTQLVESGETGAITIHFNGDKGLRRGINRSGKMVNPKPSTFGIDSFMRNVKLEVVELVMAGETGAITIHFGDNGMLRREIDRRGEMVTVDKDEVLLSILESSQA